MSVLAGSVPGRIGLYAADILRGRTRSHGIANYTVTLARALAPLLGDRRLIIYTNSDVVHELPAASSNLVHRVLRTPARPWERLYADNYGIERIAATDDLDVLHYPRGFAARFRVDNHRRIATIHDDLPIQYASGRWGRAGLRWRYFASALRFTLRAVDQIITDSNFTRHRLIECCEELGVESPEITVIYPGVSIPPVPRVEKRKYVLLFSSKLPHKRTVEGVQLASRYLQVKNLDWEVHLIGEVPPGLVSDGRVVHIGLGLSGEQVRRALAEARCLVFPSMYEGFGLPPVEAFCSGTPAVFALNGTSEEVMGDICTSFNLDDPASFDHAMDVALSMSGTDVEAIGSSLRNRFSPERMAATVLTQYDKVISRKVQKPR